jgi:FkbH-like protein
VTITEALKIIQNAPSDAHRFQVTLACGFTPLHLQTFLAARLQSGLPNKKVIVSGGLYGDLAGTVENAITSSSLDGLVIALEWPDVDPRLGFRSAGSWGLNAANDIVASASMMLNRLASALARIPAGTRIALSLPTLPLPPLFHTPGWKASPEYLELQAQMWQMAASLAKEGHVLIVNAQQLGSSSPEGARYDFKGDLHSGLPYTLQHADTVASSLATAVSPPAPKKGIITDLDDTLWKGIVGEVGPENVCWDLNSHAHLHGLYQKLLASFCEHGTLVAVASKNDPAVVAKAFERSDLLLLRDQVFPVEVHWNAKSTSVARILQAWNIAADSVLFVDDSPMELAEVAAAHPGIECVLFPKNDYEAGLATLNRLRDWCGKVRISEDDSFRLQSIRQGAAFHAQVVSSGTPESFLEGVDATVTLDFAAANEPRVLELVNKTNQFNLNGRRFSGSEWITLNSHSDAITVAVSYADKFGPLGTISVLAGRQEGDRLIVECWVMSCRAFARRIEHQTLSLLFDSTECREIEFRFAPTPKNGPLQDFMAGVLDEIPTGTFTMSRQQFEETCPPLYHQVREIRRTEVHG